MSLTQAIIQVGPHFQTTKWQQNLFPNPHLFSKWMNCITHILLLWAWRHTCTLSGLPLSRQYEIPLLFQTKIRLYRESETKIFKIRIFNLAENEFQTTKSLTFPWLLEFCHKFPDFSRFSRSVATLHCWAHCQCRKTLHELCEWTETNIWLLELLFVMNI